MTRNLVLLVSLVFAPSALAWEGGSASTIGATSDGHLVLNGVDGSARHTHGGQPAKLGYATFHLRYSGSTAATLTVDKVEFLRDRSCDKAPSTVQSTVPTPHLFALGTGATESSTSLPLTTGLDTELQVAFPVVDAYYVHCDRFAFRAHFRVGDEVIAVVSETNITRMQPLRR